VHNMEMRIRITTLGKSFIAYSIYYVLELCNSKQRKDCKKLFILDKKHQIIYNVNCQSD